MNDALVAPGPAVCLVCMPYASLERPSIALSLLKAALARTGIGAEVVYGNLAFAEEVGVEAHNLIGKSQSHSLAGEWTFGGAAFPGFEGGTEAYFAHVASCLRVLQPLVRRAGGRGRVPGILREVRERAPSFVDRMAKAVVARRPRIVGCSSMFQQHCASLALLRRVRELDPGIVTMIGGANCESSMGVTTHAECPWIDYVFSGEADEVFPELCRRLLARGSGGPPPPDLDEGLEGVIGPRWRGAGGAPDPTGPPRARVGEMDRSPVPDYDDYFAALEDSPVGEFVEPGLLVETSRGCWWGAVSHCTFCGLNGTSMGFRSKSPRRVLDELDLLAGRYGIRKLEVVDNILDLGYLRNVIPELAASGRGYEIFFETKANLTRAQLQLMSSAGVRWLQPGIESLDDGVLKAIAKGTTARQNLQLMKWAREYGIHLLWLFLYDVPGEPDDAYGTMAGWLHLVEHLQPPTGVSFIQYNRFSPYHTRPGDFGLRLSPDRSYSFVYPWSAAALGAFAYYFDDYTGARAQAGGGRRPGLQRFHEAVGRWHEQWRGWTDGGGADPPALVMEGDGDGGWVVTDTRRCRRAARHRLAGVAARVYEACDRAQSPQSLLRELEAQGLRTSWEGLGPVVEELCAGNLLMAQDGWYLSLALRAPVAPLPNAAGYPGGRLRTAAEVEADRSAAAAWSIVA
jgi:ribosomal peptide maturation radical SAM protein 1